MIPYTTIPFFSAFFLVAVGVLIGQLVGARFRNQHQRLVARLRDRAHRQRSELGHRQAELEAHQHREKSTSEHLRRQAGELRRARDELRTLQCDLKTAARQLAQEKQAREDLAACLEDEQCSRESELERFRATIASLESNATSMHANRQALQAESEQLRQQLHDEREGRGSLLRELGDRAVADDEFDALRGNEKEKREEIQEAAAAESKLLRQRIEQLEKLNEEYQWQVADFVRQLESSHANAESMESISAQVERERDDCLNQLGIVERERAVLREQVEAATRELMSMRRDALEHAASEERLQQVVAELNQLKSAKQQRDDDVARSSREIQEVRQEVDRLLRVEDQLIEVDAEHRQVKDECKRLRRERDEARQVETATRQIVGELRDELNERLDSVEVLRREKEASRSQLDIERRQRRQIEESLLQSETRIAVLQKENESWSQRHTCALAQMDERFEQVRRWQAKAEESELRNHRAEQKIAELASQLDSQKPLTEKMRHRRFMAMDESREARVGFSFRDLQRRERPPNGSASESLVVDPELGEIYEHPPRRRDDLKKIPGIADGLEEQLFQLGVFTFRQVMAWDEMAIAAVSHRLDLGDLIRRNDWVGHARRLHQETGRSAA